MGAIDATTAAPAAMASWRAITTAGTRFRRGDSAASRSALATAARSGAASAVESSTKAPKTRRAASFGLTRPVAATRPARPTATPAAAGGERFATTARSCDAHARTAASSAGPASFMPPATAPRAVRCGSAASKRCGSAASNRCGSEGQRCSAAVNGNRSGSRSRSGARMTTCAIDAITRGRKEYSAKSPVDGSSTRR